MERMGGKEQLLEQMYSAIATQRDETVDLALRSYGQLPAPPVTILDVGSSTSILHSSQRHSPLACAYCVAPSLRQWVLNLRS